MAAKEINIDALAQLLRRGYMMPNDHAGMLLDSLHLYIEYGYVEAPGHDKDFSTSERLPREAMLALADFLIESGEEADSVQSALDAQWDEMVLAHEDKVNDMRMRVSLM